MKKISNFEYVVYLQNGGRLNRADENLVYQLLNSLAYPMRSNPLNAAALSTLSHQEKSLLYSNEAELILCKLKKINPELEIILFPKSLLQFYLFAACEGRILSDAHEFLVRSIKSIVDKLTAEREREAVRMLKAFTDMGIPCPSVESQMEGFNPYVKIGHDPHYLYAKDMLDVDNSRFDNECYAANSSPLTQEIWSAVNYSLTIELMRMKFSADANSFRSYTDKWLEQYQSHCLVSMWNKTPKAYDFCYIPENITLLKSIIYFEISCMFSDIANEMYIIYRGSKLGPLGDILLISQQPWHRLSFSNGICEGVINDKDACAWQYFQLTITSSQQPNTGYAMLFDINKDGNIIKVPPLNGVARLFGRGEDFHVRTNPKKNERLAQLLRHQTCIISDMRAIRIRIDSPTHNTQLMLSNYHLYKSYKDDFEDNSEHNPYQLVVYRPRPYRQ